MGIKHANHINRHRTSIHIHINIPMHIRSMCSFSFFCHTRYDHQVDGLTPSPVPFPHLPACLTSCQRPLHLNRVHFVVFFLCLFMCLDGWVVVGEMWMWYVVYGMWLGKVRICCIYICFVRALCVFVCTLCVLCVTWCAQFEFVLACVVCCGLCIVVCVVCLVWLVSLMWCLSDVMWCCVVVGVHEAEDVIASISYLANLPYVDANKVAIWGWSYG